MDAVMELARAASIHSLMPDGSNAEESLRLQASPPKAKKSSNGASKQPAPSRKRKADSEYDSAESGPSNATRLPFDAGGGEDGGDSPVASGSGSSGKQQRAVSEGKRAEQNRKAQRAFRQRRDEKIKELEVKCQQYEVLEKSYKSTKEKLNEALANIEDLKRENERLRRK